MQRTLEPCIQDLRHGAMLLRRDASTSILIVLVLTLGIGGNAAIFTLLKAAFVDPLPYRDAGRLVTVTENTGWMASDSEFLELRARSRTLDRFAFAEHNDVQLTGSGEPARVFTASVTASFFPTLGVSASQGRTFLDEENQPGRAPVAVLTDAFWRSRMGADPGVIGKTLRLDGQAATVVGVLPSGFAFDYPTLRIAEPVDIYLAHPVRAATFQVSSSGRGTPVRVIARLRDGVTIEQARAELHAIGSELIREHPAIFRTRDGSPSRFNFDLIPLREAIVGGQKSLLWMMLSGVGALLLIACANTAQLLLARSLRRRREVAIRSALGASRPRLIRQFLMEGLVLAMCGGAAGLILAPWILRALIALLPVRSPLLASSRIDGRALGVTLAVSLLSGLTFAIIPAIKGSRWMPGPSLGAPATRDGNRWRHAMIAIEAALSVFLLCGAGLIAQNLWTLMASPMGFDADHVVVMQVKLPWARHQDVVDRRAGPALGEYIRKIEAIPGVDSAATVTGPPLHAQRIGNGELAGVNDADGAPKVVWSDNHLVSRDYFRTLRIPLLAGRTFREDDAAGKAMVAMVNQEFASRFGYGADIVGKQMPNGPGAPPITIVGMVGNARARGLSADPFPEIYLSSLQLDWPNVYLVVRSGIPMADLMKQVRAAIESANSEQAVFSISTMTDFISGSFQEPRFDAWLMGAFALLATAMAAAGMYSVLACLVSQRMNEVAIRMALGAGRHDIVKTILGPTMAWVTAGLAGGLGCGLAARTTVRSLSSIAITGSPWIYAMVALFFLMVTLAAAVPPIRRASRLDPAIALRND